VNLGCPAAFAQSVSVSASASTGSPGDKITFTYSYDTGTEKKDRTEIKFDGAGLERTDVHGGSDTFDTNAGTFEWTATPGTHVFRIFLRTKDDGGNDHYFTETANILISGWETNEFVHPGITLSEEELDSLRAKINSSEPSLTKTAGEAYIKSARQDVDYQPMYGGWEIVSIGPGPDNEHGVAYHRDSGHLYRLAYKWALGGGRCPPRLSFEFSTLGPTDQKSGQLVSTQPLP